MARSKAIAWREFILSLLGTAAISGALGIYVTYHFEEQKIVNQENRSLLKEKRRSYEAVDRNVRKLEGNAHSVTILIAASLENPKDKALAGNIKPSMVNVGEAMKNIYDGANHADIDQDTHILITEVREALAPKLATAQADSRKLGEIVDLYDDTLKGKFVRIGENIQKNKPVISLPGDGVGNSK